MDQRERRRFLIEYLLAEGPAYRFRQIPEGERDERDLLRSLMNVRPPRPVSEEFLRVQDEYLRAVIAEKGVTPLTKLRPAGGDLYLWRGDITLLECDAIVNAANSRLLGCTSPLHYCVDNAIHTFSGVQLRLRCAELMEAQGYPEPTGRAKLTPAYNLPSRYVIHTVGPIVTGTPTDGDREALASSYVSCLRLAEENGCGSIAFPCISTGVFGFPKEAAAETAVKAVRGYKARTGSGIKAVFAVFDAENLSVYRRLLW